MTEIYQFPERLRGIECVGDIEANGLLEPKLEMVAGQLVTHPPADRLWMACHKIASTGECWDFIDDEILKTYRRALDRYNRRNGREGTTILPMSLLPQFWEHCGVQVYHYGMKYDFPVVEKLLGYHLPREKRWDTLIQSATQNCDREHVLGSSSGAHSIESWALRINKGTKVVHEDWLNFSEEMYHRCVRDVEILIDVQIALDDEREIDRVECNIDWTEALRTEHMAAFWISYSEMWGFPMDTEYAKGLVVEWDAKLIDIEDELLPAMPFRIDFDRCGTKINWETYSATMLKYSGLTRIPEDFIWDEEASNKPQPVWNPFKKNGDVTDAVKNFWIGKDAQPEIPAQPEVIAVPAVKDEKGKVIVKAIRAKKAKLVVAARALIPDAYDDDAGLTSPPVVKMTHEDVGGPFTRIRWSNYNLGSNTQVLEFLTNHTKWEPTEYTDKGNPRLTEDSFDSIGEEGLGEKIKEYLITKARRTTVENFKDPSKGWLNKVRDDGRVTPINQTMGTPTARSRHAGMN